MSFFNLSASDFLRSHVNGVAITLSQTGRRRALGGGLLSFFFPDQPVHCFLPCLEPAEFPLGEGLQRFVKDFGQTADTHKGCPLYIRPIKYTNLLHPGDRSAAERAMTKEQPKLVAVGRRFAMGFKEKRQ